MLQKRKWIEQEVADRSAAKLQPKRFNAEGVSAPCVSGIFSFILVFFKT
jgi:hypothetical protein